MAAIDIVYGIIENPAAALARYRAEPYSGPRLRPMSATIADGMPPLRLNTHGWANFTPEAVQMLSGTDALLAYCRERLRNRVSVFSLAIRSFVDAYLDFAMSEVERRREMLEQRILEAGLPRDLGCPTYRDWIFSALLPLPAAYIAVDAPAGEEAFVRADLLFWNGTSALVVLLEGRSMRTPRERRGLVRLVETHPTIRVISIPYPPDRHSWSFGAEFLALVGGSLLPSSGFPFGPYRILQPDR